MIMFIVLMLIQLCLISALLQRIQLVITREILSGFTKRQVTINGTVPGPTLNITLGNWVEV